MKLRNKKTGEIVDYKIIAEYDDVMSGWRMESRDHLKYPTLYYDNIEKIHEEWEDYEEPKGTWTIDPMNEDYIDDGKYTAPDELERYEELGLKFETKEEAEKAVEKLKAWKRLKDKGFKVIEWTAGLGDDNYKIGEVMVGFDIDGVYDGNVPDDTEKDLDLLFGGKE